MKLKTLIPALLCASGLASALSPVETYGALSIKNAKLVDSAGKPVTLRGMSLFWHLDMGGKEFWTPSVVKYVQINWHNSIIRAPVGVDNRTIAGGTIKGAIEDPTTANTRIHTIVDAAIDAGSYVIVDWHTEQIHEAEAKAFFGALAKEYGNTPNIIWEIYNEPNGPGWGQIAAYAKNVITEIRKYSDNVVLVGNSSWDQHPDEAGTELDGFKNIAYTVHFYSSHTHWGTMPAAVAKGHAVFGSEWGMSGTSGDGGFVDASSGNIKQWLDNMNSQGVSHCNWSLGNPNGGKGATVPSETSAALTQTASYTPFTSGGWGDDALTASGKSIKAYLVGKNPEWTLSDTSTKMTKPLSISSTKKTNFVLGADTITFAASFNKATAWSLVLLGKTSGAKRSYTGSGANVVATHLASSRNPGTTIAWTAGETVEATLSPLGSKVTYALSTTSNSVRLTRLHETRIHWEGTRIFMPNGLISASAPVRVVIRNAQGQVLWQKNAAMGTYGWVELGEAAPRFSGVQFIEVHSDEAIVRSSWAPSF